jgi:hypothetical protein
MRRDLTRDLEVLDRLSVPELLEDAERRALGPDRGPVLGPSPARRRVMAASLLTVAVVGFAIAGFAWLSSVFRAMPAPPAEPVGSNYVFSNVRPGGSSLAGDPENFLIRLEVSWSGETSPGVHRCVFRLLDEDGDVVAERADWVLWHPSDNVALDVPSVSNGRPVSAVARCDLERLDTPGITSIEESLVLSADDDGRIDDYSEELNRRVDAWSQRFSIGSMSQNELAANVTALRDASTRSVVEDVASADFEELMGRINRLCDLVQPTMDVRGC